MGRIFSSARLDFHSKQCEADLALVSLPHCLACDKTVPTEESIARQAVAHTLSHFGYDDAVFFIQREASELP
jgi:hypothetical protein